MRLERQPENSGGCNWSTYVLALFIDKYTQKTQNAMETNILFQFGKVQYFLIITIYQLVPITLHILFHYSKRHFTV